MIRNRRRNGRPGKSVQLVYIINIGCRCDDIQPSARVVLVLRNKRLAGKIVRTYNHGIGTHM